MNRKEKNQFCQDRQMKIRAFAAKLSANETSMINLKRTICPVSNGKKMMITP